MQESAVVVLRGRPGKDVQVSLEDPLGVGPVEEEVRPSPVHQLGHVVGVERGVVQPAHLLNTPEHMVYSPNV